MFWPWLAQCWCHLWLAGFSSHQKAPARAGQKCDSPPRLIYSNSINPYETALSSHSDWNNHLKTKSTSLLLWQISLRSLRGSLSSAGHPGGFHAAAFEFALLIKTTRKTHKTATPGRTGWSTTRICEYFWNVPKLFVTFFPSICHVCSWSKYQRATVVFVCVYAASKVGILENFNLWCF